MGGEGKEADPNGHGGIPPVAERDGGGGGGTREGGAGGIGSASDRGTGVTVRDDELLGTVQQLAKLNDDRSSPPLWQHRGICAPRLSPGRPVPPSFLVPSYSPPPPHSPWPSRLGFPNRAAKSRELQERVALLQQQVHARVRARSCAKCAVIRSTLRYPMPQITIRFPILRPWPCTRAKAGTPDSKPCFLSNPYTLYPTPRTPTLTHQASVSGLVCVGWSSWCRVY